jgi:membrane peptidoglycan carboxypeptidase
MTSSARRLGGTPAGQVRLSPRARAVLAARHAAAPAQRPHSHLGQALVTIALVGLLVVGALGSAASLVAAGVVNSLAANLPDPSNLAGLTFDQPTVIYDRTGKVELARFELQNRRVVAFADVPKLVLDATTTAEDRSFWQNGGFDPGAIVAAAIQNASGGADERGASTITQQLVRARLLPPEVQGGDRYARKVLEVLQASRVTAANPGEDGKDRIITAYLNEIYYGHEAYGVAAAAQIYFGVTDLSQLTPAQAALLAGLPKSPSTYDPYRYAVADASGKLVVPASAPPVVRRNYILENLSASRWTQLTPNQLQAALAEPVVLAGVHPPVMKAPQFTWAVRSQLIQLLGSAEAVDSGGYTVITTLDWNAQQLAEKYMTAAAIIPNLSRSAAAKLESQLKIGKADRGWIAALRGKGLHNGALVAIDYRSGDVLAYVGSAGYYRSDLASPKFQPMDDAAAAYRQPGSAFKAVLYSTAFDQHVLTPGSLLLDISTQFGRGWAPKDADTLERGPVLVRGAIQQSLNLPAIRALQRVGNQAVANTAAQMGVQFLGGPTAFLQAGLAGAIGTVETRPIDLVGAFGTIANGGVKVPTRLIQSIAAPDGTIAWQPPDAYSAGTQAISAPAAFLTTDILAGNTDPKQNRFWAATLELTNTPGGHRRPAAAKTGTADSRRDFSTYGFLPPPANDTSPALAVGVWMGNSDHSAPDNSKAHPTSLSTAGEVWHAFIRDYTKRWPVAQFQPPKGVVRATIDRWSGGKPGPWTRATTTEWFIDGTQPGAKGAVDQPGLLYVQGCGGWMVDPVKAELGPKSWDDDVQAWLDRARRGVGVKGPLGSTTAYWFGASSWGGPLYGPCAPKPTPTPGPGGGNGGGHGGGGGVGGGGGGTPGPSPTPIPSP